MKCVKNLIILCVYTEVLSYVIYIYIYTYVNRDLNKKDQ